MDGTFLAEVGVEITEMNSGCICCSLVGDFGRALEKVVADYAPERILIHGDQPKALIFAKKLRDAVESEGIKVMYSGDAH